MRWLTAGESHGPALVGIIEGLPAGLEIDLEFITRDLKLRKVGYGRGERQKIETDHCEVLSGLRFGKTLGSPVSLVIRNLDFESWKDTMAVFGNLTTDRAVTVARPGHADWSGSIKYQHKDMRNVLERASARETTVRVALGSFARKFLNDLGVRVVSRVVEIGGIEDRSQAKDSQWWSGENLERIESSELRVLSSTTEADIKKSIDLAKAEGNTLGGIFEVVALNLPVGLGSYAQADRRLEGLLGQALMSLNAIKGVEIGDGFNSAKNRGSEAHDEYRLRDGDVESVTNRSGGITGGMSSGQPLIVRAAMKPLSTMKKPLSSVSTSTKSEALAHFERSDVCAVPAAAVISESLVCLELAKVVLEKFGGDSMSEIKERVEKWRKHEKEWLWKSEQ